MTTETAKRTRLLFVDDDATFLTLAGELFGELSKGNWEIATAQTHAQALAELQARPMDVVVLDIGMPVMDGIQFLSLLRRSHPEQQVAMLTGATSEDKRKACLDLGAALFLQKPTAPGDYASVFTALEMLAAARQPDGFRGVMRRVGLHEVLQFECLGKRSSVLEIFTTKARGRIYIHDGNIIHAENGNLQGEVALYGLLALRGGEFNLLAFNEPTQRTIAGSWEMLLMEAARLSDEAAQSGSPESPEPAFLAVADPPPVGPPPVATPSAPESTTPRSPGFATPPPPRPVNSRTVEVMLCSGAGEVLYDWECRSVEQRLLLMNQIEQHAAKLSALGTLGRFDRLEVATTQGRVVIQIQPHRRLLVRSAYEEVPPS